MASYTLTLLVWKSKIYLVENDQILGVLSILSPKLMTNSRHWNIIKKMQQVGVDIKKKGVLCHKTLQMTLPMGFYRK